MQELKNVRQNKNFSCREMAEQLNISKPFYWQLENNKRRISYEMAFKIANILETTPDALFYKEFKNKVKF